MEPSKYHFLIEQESEIRLRSMCDICNLPVARVEHGFTESGGGNCKCRSFPSLTTTAAQPSPELDQAGNSCFPSIAQTERKSPPYEESSSTGPITRKITLAGKIALEDPEKLVGKTIGDGYLVVEFIGRGLSGHVYKASRQGLAGWFALKIITPSLGRDKRQNDRFLQEAKAAQELDHANIIALYDAGVTDDLVPYLVTDFFEGQKLSELLEADGPMNQEAALAVFIQICEGLTHAHYMGIAHRDVKPSNVRINERSDGEPIVKLADCGVSKVLPDASRETRYFTETGFEYGDARYMSPEQCRGAKTDQRSDIYSLGCLMYECLSGRPPFIADRTAMLLYKHVRKRPKTLSERFPTLKVSKDLEDLIMRCLEKEPANRYQSVSALREDLETIKEKRPVKRAFKKRLISKGRTESQFSLIPENVSATIAAGWFGLSSTARLCSIALAILLFMGAILFSLVKLSSTPVPLPFFSRAIQETAFEKDLGELESQAIALYDQVTADDPRLAEKVDRLVQDIQLTKADLKHPSIIWGRLYKETLSKDFHARLVALKALYNPPVDQVNTSHQIFDTKGNLLFETEEGTPKSQTLLRAIATGCDLTGANLSRSSLEGITISGGNLENADFTSCDMRSVTIENTNLSRATFDFANLEHSRWNKVNAQGTNLLGTVLTGSTMVKTSLEGASLQNVSFENVDFFGGNMMNTNFASCNLANSLLLENADNASISTSPQVAELSKIKIEMENKYERLGDLRLGLETLGAPGYGQEPLDLELPGTSRKLKMIALANAEAMRVIARIDEASAACQQAIEDARLMRRTRIAAMQTRDKVDMTSSNQRLKTEIAKANRLISGIDETVTDLARRQPTSAPAGRQTISAPPVTQPVEIRTDY